MAMIGGGLARVALLPVKYPITCDTAYFGGIPIRPQR
jgi:hypothetical protein